MSFTPFKLGVTVVIWIVLYAMHGTVQSLVLADVSVSQLEDSDGAYAKFQMIKKLLDFYWVLYVLPLLMFLRK